MDTTGGEHVIEGSRREHHSDRSPLRWLGRQLPTTIGMAAAAAVAALIAIFGERGATTPTTITAALLGLVPWTLVAGGVRVRPALFALATLVPTVVIVVVDQNPGGMFPAMLTVVWVARASGDWRVVTATIAVPTAAIIALAAQLGSTHQTGMVYFMGGIGISALSGFMLRRQEQLLAEVHALSELRLEHAAAAERTRIAREVHDVVAHSLTVAMLNVGGARRALRTDPALADEALERAETVGRESLDSIRQVVGLLRAQSSPQDMAEPMPDISAVIDLIDRYRDAGLPISTDFCEPTAPVDAATGLVVYRVIQESLSNAIQHAASAPTTVSLSAPDPQHLLIEVVNTAGHASRAADRSRSGLGLQGMLERVRAVGGTLDAGPTANGGWRVAATIPWSSEPTPPRSSQMSSSPRSSTSSLSSQPAAPSVPATSA